MRILPAIIEKRPAILMQGGWVNEIVYNRIVMACNSKRWNFTTEITQSDDRVLIHCSSNYVGDVTELAWLIQDVIYQVIPTAFTGIRVNPYKLPEYDNKGGLTVLMLVAEETECPIDYGSWNEPVTLKPTDNVMYNKVIDLLNDFKMPFYNFTKGI